MFLEENMRCIRMQKWEWRDPFLTRIHEVWDLISVVGETPQPTNLMIFALNNVSEEWKNFVQSILDGEKLLEWDRMWLELQPKELRWTLLKRSINGNSRNRLKVVMEEENVTLASKGPNKGHGEQIRKKKDLSMVKCFRCGEFGHYST